MEAERTNRRRALGTAAAAAIGAVLPLAGASAQGSPPARVADRAQAQAALGKIEANLAEASSNLYLHAMLPQAHPSCAAIAEDLRDDMSSVDRYVAELESMRIPEETRRELARFKDGWARARSMAEPLASASAERPAQAEALVAHWRAVEDLDQMVDAALEAIQRD